MQLSSSKASLEVSPQLKAFGIPFISAVVLILIVIFAIFPLWRKVSVKQTELNSAKTRLTQLTAKENKLKEYDGVTLNNQFQVAEISLPSGKEVPPLLVGISRLYQQQGMTLTNLKITPGKVSTDSAQPNSGSTSEAAPAVSSAVATGNQEFPSNRKLDFDLVLSGTLEQSRGFLQTLEKSLRLLVVNTFVFSTAGDGKTQLTLTITAPFEPLPAVPTDFTVPLPELTKSDLDNLGKLSSYTPVTTPFSSSFVSSGDGDPFANQASPPPTLSTQPSISPTPTSTKSASSSAVLPR